MLSQLKGTSLRKVAQLHKIADLKKNSALNPRFHYVKGIDVK